MADCIFCEVHKDQGKLLYKDSECYAILDKFPADEGHILVISTNHYENMLEAPNKTVERMFIVAKRLGQKQREELKCEGINIATNIGALAGQVIFHFHIHVIPRYAHSKRIEYPKRYELEAEKAEKLLSKLKHTAPI